MAQAWFSVGSSLSALDIQRVEVLRGEWIYTGDQFFQATNFPPERQGGYSLFNFRVTWSNADDTVSVAGYVLNAFDERYFTLCQGQGPGLTTSEIHQEGRQGGATRADTKSVVTPLPNSTG